MGFYPGQNLYKKHLRCQGEEQIFTSNPRPTESESAGVGPSNLHFESSPPTHNVQSSWESPPRARAGLVFDIRPLSPNLPSPTWNLPLWPHRHPVLKTCTHLSLCSSGPLGMAESQGATQGCPKLGGLWGPKECKRTTSASCAQGHTPRTI